MSTGSEATERWSAPGMCYRESGHLSGNVFVHDLTGRNTALAVADFLSEQGAEVTLNTQDGHIGAEAMVLEVSPFMKRFYERGVQMTVDQELISAHAEDKQTRVTIRNMHTTRTSERFVDHLVVEGGTLPNDALFYELKPQAANNGVLDLNLLSKGLAQPDHGSGLHLYRVGDASGSRDIHCAMLDFASPLQRYLTKGTLASAWAGGMDEIRDKTEKSLPSWDHRPPDLLN